MILSCVYLCMQLYSSSITFTNAVWSFIFIIFCCLLLLWSLISASSRSRCAADVELFADCLHYFVHGHMSALLTHTYIFAAASSLCISVFAFVFLLCVCVCFCIFILINVYCIWFCAIKTCSPTFGVCVVLSAAICAAKDRRRKIKITHVWAWSDCGLNQHGWVNTPGKNESH